MQSKKDRFSIRKLAIGAASVLLGFCFMGMTAQSAKAEIVNPVEKDKQEIVNKDQTPKTVGGGGITLSINWGCKQDNYILK